MAIPLNCDRGKSASFEFVIRTFHLTMSTHELVRAAQQDPIANRRWHQVLNNMQLPVLLDLWKGLQSLPALGPRLPSRLYRFQLWRQRIGGRNGICVPHSGRKQDAEDRVSPFHCFLPSLKPPKMVPTEPTMVNPLTAATWPFAGSHRYAPVRG